HLATSRAVSVEATLDYPHIPLDESSTLFSFLTAAAADLGKRIRVRVQMQSFDNMCRMVERELGVGILPSSCAERIAKHMNISILSLTDAWAPRDRFIIVRSLAALPK